MRQRTRIRLILVMVGAAAAITAFLWMLSPRFAPDPGSDTPPPAAPLDTSAASSETIDSSAAGLEDPFHQDSTLPAPVDPASSEPPSVESDSAFFESAPIPGTPVTPAELDTLRLMIPVAGIPPEELMDTYTDARSEGRVHNAIDIIAPRGTPVVAAADGRIIKLFESELGGITFYQLSADGRRVYYYAHLDRYAEGITEGKPVRKGEIIAYVGDTGNATPGNYHLHFAIWFVTEPARYWDGVSVNPYPILKRSAQSGEGAPGNSIK